MNTNPAAASCGGTPSEQAPAGVENAQPGLIAELARFPKALTVVRAISSMVDPEKPLDVQHDAKLLWHTENLSAVLSGEPFAARAITAELDLTLECSYDCSCCTYGSSRRRTADQAGARSMSREVIAVVLRRLADGGVRGVIITGGGEPLQNPEAPFALQTARQLGLRAGLFTNGSLLVPDLAERILAARPQFIRISANAVTPEVYTRFHGLDDERWAHVVWDNIRFLAERTRHSEVNFGLGVVVNRINVDDLLPLFERALEVASRGGRLYVAVRPVVNYSGRAQITPDVVARAKKACVVGRRLAEGTGLNVFVAAEYLDEVAAAGQRDLPPPSQTHCVGHSWMVSVGWNADVYLCSEGKYDPRNRLGNLLEQTLDEIWGSALRQQVIHGCCQRPPVCKARRLTSRIERLMEPGPLDDNELGLVEAFLSELRSTGHPGDVEFL